MGDSEIDSSFVSEKETDSSYNEISSNSDVSEKNKPGNISKFTTTCSFFYNNGYCKFGNKCRYKHLKKSLDKTKQFMKNQKPSVPRNVHENRYSNRLNPSKQICKFSMIGDCKKGDNCEYLHSLGVLNSDMNSLTISSVSQNIPKKIFSSSDKSKKKPLCYYFKKGFCYNGDSCKYYHAQKIYSRPLESSNSFQAEKICNNPSFDTDVKSVSRTNSNFRRTLNVYDASALTPDSISELRLLFCYFYNLHLIICS